MHTEQKSMVARVMAARDNRQTSPVHTNSKVQGEVQKENGCQYRAEYDQRSEFLNIHIEQSYYLYKPKLHGK